MISVAEQLTRARNLRQASIGEVARTTRVSAHLIRALESGDYGTFSAAFYARGCVGILARHYRLDGRALKRQLMTEFPCSSPRTDDEPPTGDLPDFWCYWIACLRLDSVAPWMLSILLLSTMLAAYTLGRSHGARQEQNRTIEQREQFAARHAPTAQHDLGW